MKQSLRTILFILFLLLSLSVTACGLFGGTTETGNPTNIGNQNDDDTDTGNDCSNCESLPVTDSVLNSLCGVIDECFANASASACATALDANTNALQAFGVNTATHQSFTAVQTAVDAGQITVVSTVLNDCLDALDALTCTQALQASAFNNAVPSNYSNVYRVVPDECENLF